MSRRGPRARGPGFKWILLTLAGGGAVCLASVFLRRAHTQVYPPNAFHEVKRADMLVSVVEDGALRALNETVIRSGLEGINRIIHLAPEGSHANKGDLLVELDSSTLKDRLNEQELAHQERLFQMLQATANLKIQKSLAESQVKEAELRVETAESDLEKYRDGDAPLMIRTVESRSGVLAEQVRIAAERHARTQELFKTGNATRSELEADALSLKREQLGFEQYQEDLRLIKKFDQPKQVRLLESKVAQAKAELERLKQRTFNEIAQAEADLKTSQRSVELLEESLKTQRRRLESAKIYAPQDGLVVYALVSPFQFMDGAEGRRDEGRFRGGRGGGGPGGGGASGEFRGGGRRGGRFNSERDSGSASSSSSSAQSASAANPRAASTSSGTAATQTSPTLSAGGSSSSGGGGSGSSSGGARGGGTVASGGQSGGSASASSAFVSYPSMRPSSSLGSIDSASTGSGSGSSGSTASASSSSSSGNAQMVASVAPQMGFRSSSQNFPNFSGFDSFGASGFLEEGAMVRQRQELIRLPDVSKMLAEIKIHESRVGQVRPGMTAYVRIESIPNRRFKGTVRRVALLPDSQVSWMSPNLKVFPTDVLIEEELPALRPGVSARAEIIITNLTRVVSVPIQTVARWRGENVCFVKKGTGVAPVAVTTGWFNDRFVEITSGLREGDRVLLAPVGDEAIEQSSETNQVESATEAPARAASSAEEAPAEERRMQRRNSDTTNGDAAPERRRNRQGGRRSQTAEEAPESETSGKGAAPRP